MVATDYDNFQYYTYAEYKECKKYLLFDCML